MFHVHVCFVPLPWHVNRKQRTTCRSESLLPLCGFRELGSGHRLSDKDLFQLSLFGSS